MKHVFGAVVAVLMTVNLASADGLIATREELMGMLGVATTDDYETLDIAEGSTMNTGLTTLDDATMIYGQGPGLVHAGATYTSIRGPLTWVGANYLDLLPSKTLIVWNPNVAPAALLEPQLFFAFTIHYDPPTQAVGIDILRFGDMGTITVEIYDTIHGFGDEFLVPTPTAGEPYFFGYLRQNGITEIVVKNTLFGTVWSPNIDNHTYGVLGPTPAEPTSWGRIKTLYR